MAEGVAPRSQVSTDAATPQSKAQRALRSTAKFIVSQWSLLLMALLIVLAYFFPNVGMVGGPLHAEYTVSWGAVGLIFLIAGMSLDIDLLVAGIPQWKAHIVSNTFSLLLAPAIMFGFATAGRTADLDFYVMAGMVITGCMPTGISNNVTCTMNAGGSAELASIEVLLGAVLGTFITPLLAGMFLNQRDGWGEAAPGSNASVTDIYVRMAKQLSATLIGPLIVGLLLQYFFPKAIVKTRRTLHIGKWATVLTMLCVWENFCKAFASGAFETASSATIIYLCLISFSMYLTLSAVMWTLVRLPHLPTPAAKWWRMSKRDTIAMCFTGPAKGVAVGAPLLAIMYADVSLERQAKMALSLLIYNGEQVACTQLMVPLLRHWARDEIHKKDDDAALPSPGAAAAAETAADPGAVEAGGSEAVQLNVIAPSGPEQKQDPIVY